MSNELRPRIDKYADGVQTGAGQAALLLENPLQGRRRGAGSGWGVVPQEQRWWRGVCISPRRRLPPMEALRGDLVSQRLDHWRFPLKTWREKGCFVSPKASEGIFAPRRK